MHIGTEEHGPHTIDQHRAGLNDAEQRDRRQTGHHNDHRGRRQDALRSARIEVEEAYASVLGDVAEQEARNKETRNNEEDVDPDEPATEPGDVSVIQDDDADREGAQTLNVLTEL